ncbi:MAG: 50S ribosomal protein L18 [Patescibacteria group bacterium]
MNKNRKKVNRVRAKIKASGRGRRLSVFRSSRYLWAQIVDLTTGRTLLGLGDKKLLSKETKKLTKVEKAFKLGEALAKEAKKQGIKQIVFDRGPYPYHGRVKALAEGARAGGLKF